MALLFTLPRVSTIDLVGEIAPRSRLYFYQTASSTPQPVYADSGLTTALTQPVTASDAGLFASIYLNDELPDYKIVCQDENGSVLWTVDPYLNGPTQGQIGRALYPRTTAEIAAGVTPSNYSIPSHEIVCEILVERYGFDASDTTSDQTTVIDKALDVAVALGGGKIVIPKADFRASLTVEHSGIYFRGQGAVSGATRWRNVGAAAPLTWNNANRSIVGGGVEDIEFINQNSGTFTTTDGIVISSEATGINQNDFLTFRRVLCTSFRDGISITGRSIWNNWDQVYCFSSLRDGFHVESSDNWAMQQFTACRFGGNARHGFYLNHTFTTFLSPGIVFSSCNFEINGQNAIRITGAGGVAGMSFISCYGEENAGSVSAGSSSPRKAAVHVDSVYAFGLSFDGCEWLGNASTGNPDYYIYVDTATTTNVHGSVADCRFGTSVTGPIYWPKNCRLEHNLYGGGTNVIDKGSGSIDITDFVSGSTAFTPAFAFGGGTTGITYANQLGRYVRHGNVIYFTAYVSLSNKGSSTGAATITGLPIASLNLTNLIGSVAVSGDQLGASVTDLQGRIAPNSTTITLSRLSTGTLTALTDADFGNSTAISVSGVVVIL